jgi:hypothetical protein
VLLKGTGEVDAARKLFEEVIEGETAQLGGSHTSTLQTMYNLAVLLENIGDTTALNALLVRLVEGNTVARGAEDPETVEVREWLAELS